MGKCIHHPERNTPYLCMKHQVYLCEECLQCKDPNIYCKHRTACPIWFMRKRQKGWDADTKSTAADACTVRFRPDRRTAFFPESPR